MQNPEVVKRFRDNSAVMDTDVNGMPFAQLGNDFEETNSQGFATMKRANNDEIRILKRLMDRRSMGRDRMNHLTRFSKRNSYQKQALMPLD